MVAATISGPMPSPGSTSSVVPERVLVSTKPSSPQSHRFAMRPTDEALLAKLRLDFKRLSRRAVPKCSATADAAAAA